MQDAPSRVWVVGASSWVFDELSFVWRHAQQEATVAYDHWHRHPDSQAYAVYRAAQDRADAAQDALRAWRGQTHELDPQSR